jgi:hypothetical protein
MFVSALATMKPIFNWVPYMRHTLILFVSSLWFPCAGNYTAVQQPRPEGTTPIEARRAAKITFTNVAMGEVLDEERVHLGVTFFKASNGNSVEVLYEDFKSPVEAQRYLERQLAKAVMIIERKAKTDAAGKVVGERAEILLRISPETTIPTILWTDGLKFHQIQSPSRDCVVELEKVYRY